ncbi:MAG: hypothetical protein JRJ02_14540 [Deltaproteobacteria bacterium]|nr:hypothetical protein [Deltaproteobacteria bacterium]
MYQEHKDVVVFRIIYLREAHASDGDWPVPYAAEKGLTEHKDYAERCVAAQKLLTDKKLTIPTIIDKIDNKVAEAYDAMPNRAFIVRKDGRLAVAASQGPRGYAPALKEIEKWLAQYKKSGKEPGLP